MEEKIRKLTKVSRYSYGVVIPKELVKKLSWKEKQKLTVRIRGKSVLISDWDKDKD